MILTKEQAARMAMNPVLSFWSDEMIEKVVSNVCEYNTKKFIRTFRKSTGLMLCSFSSDKFIIKH